MECYEKRNKIKCGKLQKLFKFILFNIFNFISTFYLLHILSETFQNELLYLTDAFKYERYSNNFVDSCIKHFCLQMTRIVQKRSSINYSCHL